MGKAIAAKEAEHWSAAVRTCTQPDPWDRIDVSVVGSAYELEPVAGVGSPWL